jgi:carbon starvation protein CstA
LSGPGGTHLSALDTLTVVVSVVVATVLMAVRLGRGVDHVARQWLEDAMNVGTLVVLAAVVASSLPWWTLDVPASPLTDIALVYCGGIIVVPMYRSVFQGKP